MFKHVQKSIKKGIYEAEDDSGSEDSDSSSENSVSKNSGSGSSSASGDEDDLEGDSDGSLSEEDDESDDEQVNDRMPTAQEALENPIVSTTGFQCVICPFKVLNTSQVVKEHLQSKVCKIKTYNAIKLKFLFSKIFQKKLCSFWNAAQLYF